MEIEEKFKFKLAALFHDTPTKVLNIQHHKNLSRKLLNELGIDETNVDEELIKNADILASALDRMMFKDVELLELMPFIYPFHQKDPEKLENLSFGKYEKFLMDNLEDLKSFREKFYTAWYLLTSSTYEDRGRFKVDSKEHEFIPADRLRFIYADTRAPNHSIVGHMLLTSAIATSLKLSGSVAFLLFSIAPVQGFIKNARKTKDLWAGSYILSFLTWEAIEYIVEEYGPDHIIFPSLAHQPWMRIFLNNAGILNEKPSVDELMIASFPNRFLAVVPYDEGIGREAEKRLKDTWRDILLKINGESEYVEELENYFDVNWVMLPWKCYEPSSKTRVKEFKKKLLKLLDEDDVEDEQEQRIPKISELWDAFEDNSRAYKSNYPVTVFYSYMYIALEKFLAGIKAFKTMDINPNKFQWRDNNNNIGRCSVCGEFPPIQKDDKDKDHLCPVCNAKRKFEVYLKEEFKKIGIAFDTKLIGKFPSTAEIAAAKLKEKALELIKEGEINSPKYREMSGNPVPILRGKFNNIPFLHIDASVLLDQREKSWIEHGVAEESFEDMKNLIRKLKDIGERFNPYYAVLMMDGDEMGKWLSGAKNKTFEEMMSKDENGETVALDSLKDKRHPMTPALHSDFSRNILEFSRKVGNIVEKHYGALIYSGGDDVLALIPVDEVLSAADEIRKLFSKEVSDKATMSAGMVITHYKHPLREVLEKVREAEKSAKNSGRNAFCLKILKHSGEEVEFISRWDEGIDVVSVIEDLKRLIEEGYVSRSFLYDAVNLLNGLEDHDDFKNIAEAVLKMLVKKKIDREKDEVEKAIMNVLNVFNNRIVNLFKVISFITRGGFHED